jgi:hypothetical protein
MPGRVHRTGPAPQLRREARAEGFTRRGPTPGSPSVRVPREHDEPTDGAPALSAITGRPQPGGHSR